MGFLVNVLWKSCVGYSGPTLVDVLWKGNLGHFGECAVEGLVWAGILKSQVLKI